MKEIKFNSTKTKCPHGIIGLTGIVLVVGSKKCKQCNHYVNSKDKNIVVCDKG